MKQYRNKSSISHNHGSNRDQIEPCTLSNIKHMKKWFSNTEQQAAQDSDP